MRKTICSASLLAFLIAPAAARAPSLEKALAGRTPGKPAECIQQNLIDSTQIFDAGAILYRMRGGPDYLNTPTPRCPNLRSDRAIVSHTYSNQLCRGDILQIIDPPSGMSYGACALSDFIPYTKPKRQ